MPISRPKRRTYRSVAGVVALTVGVTAAVYAGVTLAQADDIGGWELDALNVHEAWDDTQGDGVTIAVVDTGVAEHPYFDDKDVLPGYSLFDDEDDGRSDHHGHGTSVAASALSVAPEATLMPIQSSVGEPDYLEDQGVQLGRSTGPEIEWAVDNDADVIVLAWVTSSEDGAEREAIQYALDNDVIVIGGAGNDPAEDVWWPAAFDGVMAVSGTDTDNDLYSGSSTGEAVSVAAPATDITTAGVDNDSGDMTPVYEQAWGTSIASGLTGGVAALVLASDPDVDANNAIARMTETAVDLGDPGRDPEFGYGLVDATAAVNSDISGYDENPLGSPVSEEETDDEDPKAVEELDGNDSDDSRTDNTAETGSSNVLGIPTLAFWGIFAVVALIVLLVAPYLLSPSKNRRSLTGESEAEPGGLAVLSLRTRFQRLHGGSFPCFPGQPESFLPLASLPQSSQKRSPFLFL